SLAARANAVLPLVLRLPDAGPLHETERCGEAGVQSQESARVVEGAAVALEVDQHAAPRARRPVHLADVAPHHLPRRRPGATELEAGIEGSHAGVAAFQLAVGDERADRGLLAQLVLHPQRAEVGAASGQRIRRRYASRLPVVDRDGAEGPATGLSCQPHAGAGVYDVTRVDQVDGRLEVAGVLDEEGTLLGEKHLEALVDRNLRIVGLHLA